MIYRNRRVAPPLSQWIDCLWLYSGYRPPHAFERILPSGTAELVINLTDDRLSCHDADDLSETVCVRGPLLAAPREVFQVVNTGQQFQIMGVHFHPGGAAAFLDMPADELGGADIALADLWGSDATELREKLAVATDFEQRLDILEASLLRRHRSDLRLHRAVHAALPRLESPEPLRLADLADELGLSSRSFIQAFRSQIGLTPKAYARIRRFQNVLRRTDGRPSPEWATLALDCGYYDQAHLIRDFKAFSGLTPTAWHRLQGEHCNHVPISERTQVCPLA